MSITHSWNGTVLTITSDAGTSSADLKGDTGCRGPQGPHGIVYDADGNIIMEGFATEQYVDEMLANVKPNMEGYATEEYVDQQIVNVATGGSIDMSKYATKDYVDKAISSGAGYVEPLSENDWSDDPFKLENYQYYATPNIMEADKSAFPFDGETVLTVAVWYQDGMCDKVTGTIGVDAWNNWTTTALIEDEALTQRTRITGIKVSLFSSNGNYYCNFKVGGCDEIYFNEYVTKISVAIGTKAPGYTYINPETIPVDGTTITIVNGKLTVIGGTELESSEEVFY